MFRPRAPAAFVLLFFLIPMFPISVAETSGTPVVFTAALKMGAVLDDGGEACGAVAERNETISFSKADGVVLVKTSRGEIEIAEAVERSGAPLLEGTSAAFDEDLVGQIEETRPTGLSSITLYVDAAGREPLILAGVWTEVSSWETDEADADDEFDDRTWACGGRYFVTGDCTAGCESAWTLFSGRPLSQRPDIVERHVGFDGATDLLAVRPTTCDARDQEARDLVRRRPVLAQSGDEFWMNIHGDILPLAARAGEDGTTQFTPAHDPAGDGALVLDPRASPPTLRGTITMMMRESDGDERIDTCVGSWRIDLACAVACELLDPNVSPPDSTFAAIAPPRDPLDELSFECVNESDVPGRVRVFMDVSGAGWPLIPSAPAKVVVNLSAMNTGDTEAETTVVLEHFDVKGRHEIGSYYFRVPPHSYGQVYRHVAVTLTENGGHLFRILEDKDSGEVDPARVPPAGADVRIVKQWVGARRDTNGEHVITALLVAENFGKVAGPHKENVGVTRRGDPEGKQFATLDWPSVEPGARVPRTVELRFSDPWGVALSFDSATYDVTIRPLGSSQRLSLDTDAKARLAGRAEIAVVEAAIVKESGQMYVSKVTVRNQGDGPGYREIDVRYDHLHYGERVVRTQRVPVILGPGESTDIRERGWYIRTEDKLQVESEGKKASFPSTKQSFAALSPPAPTPEDRPLRAALRVLADPNVTGAAALQLTVRAEKEADVPVSFDILDQSGQRLAYQDVGTHLGAGDVIGYSYSWTPPGPGTYRVRALGMELPFEGPVASTTDSGARLCPASEGDQGEAPGETRAGEREDHDDARETPAPAVLALVALAVALVRRRR